jgi:hypothetical protein
MTLCRTFRHCRTTHFAVPQPHRVDTCHLGHVTDHDWIALPQLLLSKWGFH